MKYILFPCGALATPCLKHAVREEGSNLIKGTDFSPNASSADTVSAFQKLLPEQAHAVWV